MSAVAVVIPNWNTGAYLERCLGSLVTQGVSVETLIVDNGSTDTSLALLEGLDVPHLALDRNIGFAAAVNLGVASTAAPFVMVLNADCFLAPNCLRLLLAELSTDGGLGGTQPRIVQDESKSPVRIFSAGQSLTRFGAAFERGWGKPMGPSYSDRCEVFGVSGAACLLRRELLTRTGGYDAAYFAFYEDVDLNARARLAGWRFTYLPEALAVHVGHASWREHPNPQSFNVELTVRNRLATAVKVYPARAVLGTWLATLRTICVSPFRGTTAAVLAGTLTALRWLPRLLRERRRLRGGSTRVLDEWLVGRRGAGPDPGSPRRVK